MSLKQVVLLQELLADLDEPSWGIPVLERDSYAIEAPLEALIVEAGGEQLSIDRAEHFVDAVSEYEPPILDGHACLRAREKLAVHVDDVFLIHISRHQPVLTPVAL